MIHGTLIGLGLMTIFSGAGAGEGGGGVLIGAVVDDANGGPLPARVYVTGPDGKPYLPPPREGQSIVHYDVTRGVREVYAGVGPHPFRVALPAGKSIVTVERGKEYAPVTREITPRPGQTISETFRLSRGFDMAAMGWYSGDLHVHTPPEDLPITQLAEDLNVAFPITAWAQDSTAVPKNRGQRPPAQGELVRIDDTHVSWSLNTEYEIFSVEGKGLTLGAILLLGHRSPFTMTAPPIVPVVEEARRQGALIDWDKHAWPWSMMLVPVAGIETMELSNNHMWRLDPHFLLWGEQPPEWMGCTNDAAGWASFGFQTYYALLNCGFVVRPSAGTANGVHPVPLGHSRVYVRLDGEFTYDKWLAGLRKGRSFATNGPMLRLMVDGLEPGDRRALRAGAATALRAELDVWTLGTLDRVELIVNGRVAHTLKPDPPGGEPRVRHHFTTTIVIDGSSWIAARCFDVPPPGNVRFAHTGPIFLDDPSRPIRPEPREVQLFTDSVEAQMKRVSGKLSDEALAEYDRAMKAYRSVSTGSN